MKKEDLFDAIGTLDDDLLKRSEHIPKTNLPNILKYGSVAACLLLMIGTAILFLRHNETGNSAKNFKTGDRLEETIPLPTVQEKYTDVTALLATNAGTEEQSLILAQITLETHSASYQKVKSADSETLKENTGSEVAEAKGWYQLSGHLDRQYLIHCEEGEYSLWKFYCYQEDSYAYRDVLQYIYHITCADDIKEIIASPADIDNTDEGRAIQKEIGLTAITDREQIKNFYRILTELTCYGSDHWEMIWFGNDFPQSMQNQTRAIRYLTLVTADNIKIDSLKYKSGNFYEYGGIAYNKLAVEEQQTVEEILHIEPSSEPEENENTENNESQPQQMQTGATDEPENPVDTRADETKAYDTQNTSAQLSDLQNRISHAMQEKELPFVISSAIMENPDRLHITVTTQNEELLARLKAFDVTDRLLEIEYSTDIPQLEAETE